MKLTFVAVLLAAGITQPAFAQSLDAPLDWSGWWGGVSIGAGGATYSADGLVLDQFCMTDVIGTGEARCTVGDGPLQLYSRAEYLDGYGFNQFDPPAAEFVNPTGGFTAVTDVYIEDSFGWPGIIALVSTVVQVGPNFSRASALGIEGPLDFAPPRISGHRPPRSACTCAGTGSRASLCWAASWRSAPCSPKAQAGPCSRMLGSW